MPLTRTPFTPAALAKDNWTPEQAAHLAVVLKARAKGLFRDTLPETDPYLGHLGEDVTLAHLTKAACCPRCQQPLAQADAIVVSASRTQIDRQEIHRACVSPNDRPWGYLPGHGWKGWEAYFGQGGSGQGAAK